MKKIFKILSLICFLLFISLSIIACSDIRWEESKIRVVATTTMLTDLVKNIGKDRIDLRGLMGAGLDPHSYQPSAGDVKIMTSAELIFYSGLHLEGQMGVVLEELGKRPNITVICASDSVPRELLIADEQAQDAFDPHIWFDVGLWKIAAQGVAQAFIEHDPLSADYYQTNLQAYTEELDELENYISSRIAELPPCQRVLITAHDAFRYFGRAYGFTVKGLQGISTQAESNIGDINSLAEFIANNKIKAIFIESSVPVKSIQSLKAEVKNRGFEVNIGGELYSDSLGDAKSNTETYIKTFKANIDTIVNALK